MESTLKPCTQEGFRLELLGEDVFLYHPSGDKIISLNPTAALIWQLCDGETTVGEMVTALQTAYPEAAAEIAGDVHDTLQQFVELDCLTL